MKTIFTDNDFKNYREKLKQEILKRDEALYTVIKELKLQQNKKNEELDRLLANLSKTIKTRQDEENLAIKKALTEFHERQEKESAFWDEKLIIQSRRSCKIVGGILIQRWGTGVNDSILTNIFK